MKTPVQLADQWANYMFLGSNPDVKRAIELAIKADRAQRVSEPITAPQVGEIAEMAAQNIVARHKIDRDEGERGLVAFAWALGDPLDFETGLREFAAEVLEMAGNN